MLLLLLLVLVSVRVQVSLLPLLPLLALLLRRAVIARVLVGRRGVHATWLMLVGSSSRRGCRRLGCGLRGRRVDSVLNIQLQGEETSKHNKQKQGEHMRGLRAQTKQVRAMHAQRECETARQTCRLTTGGGGGGGGATRPHDGCRCCCCVAAAARRARACRRACCASAPAASAGRSPSSVDTKRAARPTPRSMSEATASSTSRGPGMSSARGTATARLEGSLTANAIRSTMHGMPNRIKSCRGGWEV